MSSRFITESEIAEYRKKKQEEWEKVRKADDPLEAPEQPYDSRSLYDRLQEQKQRKDFEYEEAHKLKNMIKGLDDDEIEFLDLVDRTKIAADRRKNSEEEKELRDYRNRVSYLQEKSLDQKLQAEVAINKPKLNTGSRVSQTKLLKGIIVTKNESIKRKSMENTDGAKKPKLDEDMETKNEPEENCDKSVAEKKRERTEHTEVNSTVERTSGEVKGNSELTCIGILPGLGYYEESSSDECSSNSDDDTVEQCTTKYDLVGRKIVAKDKTVIKLLTQKYGMKLKRGDCSF